MHSKQGYSLLIGLALVFILIAGCSQGAGSKVADKLELAVKYLAENKFEEAILAYQEAIEIDKKCVKAYQGLAKVYTIQGKYDQAHDTYEQGIHVLEAQDLIQLRLSLAGMYIDKGDLQEAEKAYKELIEQHPDIFEAYQGLAFLYQQQGQFDLARNTIEKAIQSNADKSRGYVALASLYALAGETNRALDSLVESLALNPNQANAYLALRNIFSENWLDLIKSTYSISNKNVASAIRLYAFYCNGQYEEAIDVYNRQVAQHEGNHKAKIMAAMAVLKAGQKDRAKEIALELSNKQVGPWIMADVARFHLMAGDSGAALKWAQDSFGLQPNIEALRVLSEISSKSDCYKQYVTEYVMYNWMALTAMEQELYSYFLETPFPLNVLSDGLTFDYYVPRLGFRYTFRQSDGDEETETWHAVSPGCYQSTSESNGNRDSDWYVLCNDGIRKTMRQHIISQDTSLINYLGDNYCLRYVRSGSSWDNTFQAEISQLHHETQRTFSRTDKHTRSVEFVGFEKLLVMGREMKAAKFVWEETVLRGATNEVHKGSGEIWYVKGLGMVRSNWSWTYDRPIRGSSELVSVEPL
ncbi:MAG: tetratricopeptide repeat protein [Bacillota bacterium]|nr:tetratricopeptide repeat protein [Bacillota bacterium]